MGGGDFLYILCQILDEHAILPIFMFEPSLYVQYRQSKGLDIGGSNAPLQWPLDTGLT